MNKDHALQQLVTESAIWQFLFRFNGKENVVQTRACAAKSQIWTLAKSFRRMMIDPLAPARWQTVWMKEMLISTSASQSAQPVYRWASRARSLAAALLVTAVAVTG
ncbi:MAG: hypothetical protein V4573_11505, partial [Pseudomonadota bacterium]